MLQYPSHHRASFFTHFFPFSLLARPMVRPSVGRVPSASNCDIMALVWLRATASSSTHTHLPSSGGRLTATIPIPAIMRYKSAQKQQKLLTEMATLPRKGEGRFPLGSSRSGGTQNTVRDGARLAAGVGGVQRAR